MNKVKKLVILERLIDEKQEKIRTVAHRPFTKERKKEELEKLWIQHNQLSRL